MGKELTRKHRAFVEAYLTTWNASGAARMAGYTGKSNVVGPRLLANVSIQDAIERRLNEKAMRADEIMARLTEHARGDMGDFLDITSMSFQIDLPGAKEKGLTRLIKKVKQRTTTTILKDGTETETQDIEIELYSAQTALEDLAKIRQMMKENVEHSGELKVIIEYADGQVGFAPPPSGAGDSEARP